MDMEESPNEMWKDKRLWIGNLDPRISEYQLLKILQKYGQIEHFDMLFYRTGPLIGQPRGYAFVTFKQIEDTVTCKQAMHNKLIGNKKVIVKWAHGMKDVDNTSKSKHLNIPVLGGPGVGKESSAKTNKHLQILAIETKLKLMKRNAPSIEVNSSASTKPPKKPREKL